MKTKEKKTLSLLFRAFMLSILSLTLLTFLNSQAICSNALIEDEYGEENPWSLIRSEEGITLYQRWIKLTANQEGRQICLDFEICENISNVLAGIRDSHSAKNWMTGVKSVRLLKEQDSSSWYTYMLYDIPWPLKKQDIIVQYSVYGQSGSDTIRIDMASCPGFLPLNKGITRIIHIDGMWILCRVGDHLTRVQYFIYSAQKSSFPRWLADPIIQNNLMKTMKNLKNFIHEEITIEGLHSEIN